MVPPDPQARVLHTVIDEILAARRRNWLLFEGIDTFLYDLMRKSKKTL